MTPLLKHTILHVFFFCIPQVSFAQLSNEELTEQIVSLKNNDSIRAYWNSIHLDDQANRGPGADPQKDLLCFKRMMLMIRFHGYPEGFTYGMESNTTDSLTAKNHTPNVVFMHQPSFQVREYFFPALYAAYREGKANDYWFLLNVKTLTLGRYDRIFYPVSAENVQANLALMKDHLEMGLGFDLTVVDSLFASDMRQKQVITSSEKLFSGRIKPTNWKERIVRDQHLNLYLFEDHLYLQRIYLDGSSNAPQEVNFDPKTRQFSYVYHDSILSCETELKRLLKKRKCAKMREIVALRLT